MPDALIIGAGPAGLMAAEVLSTSGHSVLVVDQMPSPARKFLMAGRGGLNLTHSEALDPFLRRYGEAQEFLAPMIRAFTPQDLRDWCEGLGQPTFVGSSGRVFPQAMKASPLLRAWLARLSDQGSELRLKTRLSGLEPRPDGFTVTLSDGQGHEEILDARVVLLALGGASWPKLGSDAGWVPLLQDRLALKIKAFRAANCGFLCDWSEHLRDRHAGTPLKRIRLTLGDLSRMGEAVISAQGIEGGVVYALGTAIRQAIESEAVARIGIDLRPDLTVEALARRLEKGPGRQSLGSFLRKAAGLTGAEVALLHEDGTPLPKQADQLAARIKSVPLSLSASYPIDRAISSAGGVCLDELDDALMTRKVPGLFLAGEMLDWEAPTGGYLLQACMAMGVHAGRSMAARLTRGETLP